MSAQGTTSGVAAFSGRRPDIQGLRAAAVLGVVFYHLAHFLVPGGYTGVDVFFVLSGYLITQVLLRPMEAGRFSLGEFYRRRIRRLYPALFVVLAFVLVMGVAFFPPALLSELVKSQFFTTLYLSNFLFTRGAGYFDIQAELKPLLHTWSLAVEEQFYLLYPLILFVLNKWLKRFLWPALFVLACLSLWAAQANLATHAAAVFYYPLSRACELLIGALCVGFERRVTLPVVMQRGVSSLGAAGIAASFILINDTTPFPGVLALLPCLSTVALLVSPQGWTRHVLTWTPVVRVGDMSYSLYLWHWPLLAFARFLFPDAAWVLGVAIVAAFGLAWLSWRYIEAPFLSDKPRPVWRLAGLAMVVSIGLSVPIYMAHGLPQRFSPAERALLAASDDYNHDRHRCHMESNRPLAYSETCVYGARDVPASYAVWGDSHGAELARALGERLGAQGASLRSITMSGCPATLSRQPVCRAHNVATMAAIKADPYMRTVILVGNLHDDDAAARASVAGLEQSALELQAAGKRPVILYPIPTQDFDPPSFLALEVRGGRAPESLGLKRARYDSRHAAIVANLDAFTRAHGIATADPVPVLCDARLCHVYKPGVGVLYFNAGHLSMTGAGLVADSLLRELDTKP